MTIQTALVNNLEINRNRIAIEYEGKEISCSDLLNKANAITRFLLGRHRGKESIIGISLRNRADLIASVIGVMNARCVFVLLDYSLPAPRLTSMINNLHPELIISSDSMEPSPGTVETNVITYAIEKITADVNGQLVAVQYPVCEPDDSLYIYFTSGSTGVPKGIVGKNSSLLHFIQWEIKEFGLTGDIRFSQFVSPYFDAFLRDVFTPLMAGATVCIPPGDEGFFSADKMVAWIDQNRIGLIHCVPSIFRVFNDATLAAGHFSNLKYILLSAEKIIPSELVNWYKIFGNRIQLVNLYGTTETTMVSSFHRVVPEDVTKQRIPAGFPIDDTVLLVSNADFIPCNPLEPGDLYIVSKYTTKGYLNNPELTNEKFLVINRGTPDETIAYKTGDKARMLTNGEIELIGREDRQVKLRGIRIELDEIERILVQYEFIKNAVVIKQTEKNGDEALVAFFIKNDQSADSELPNMIQQYLEGYLPKYMIPSGIFEVPAFPLLSNGKIDYNKLVNTVNAPKEVAPTDETEARLVRIWKEVIGDKPISTDASFHRMGGNSLSIMKLIGKIYKEFNVRISLGELFDNLTVKKQVEFIKWSKKDNLYVIARAPRKAAYNLSSAQERIYYNYELNKESTSYNLPVAWEIMGEPDVARIGQAFQSLIDRHEALRTIFGFEGGRVQQYIKEHVDFNLEEINDVSAHGINNAITGFIRPFDLNNGPLFRCGIINTREGKKMLVVDLHHIICDGMSQEILFFDFLKLYNGHTPETLPLQYKDYAEWEYNFRSSEEYLMHREFWLRSFEGDIPKLELPTLNATQHIMGEEGGNVLFTISEDTMKPLLDFLKKEEITTFSGLFALYHLFLSQLTGQEDIVIGVASSGRMQQELEKIVGMFVKMLPVRYLADPNVTFREFVKDVGKYLIQANSKQEYDLTSIVIEVNKNRSTPVESLFDVVFVFHNYQQDEPEEGNGQLSIYDFERKISKFPMTLVSAEYNGVFEFRMQYSNAYFIKADMEMLMGQFQALAETVTHNLDTRLIDIIGTSEVPTNMLEDDISFNL
jgi:mycobactin peptide synthetase MbtE